MSDQNFLNPILDAAAEFEAIGREHGWSFALIGGVAACLWGEPRATRDFDVCVFAEYGSEHLIVALLLERMAARDKDSGVAALRYRLLRVVASNGVPGDIAFGGLPFEESMLARARKVATASGTLTLASPEDLLVMKFFAGRPQDMLDIRRILTRSGRKLDMKYVRRWLDELLTADERPDQMHALNQLIAEVLGP